MWSTRKSLYIMSGLFGLFVVLGVAVQLRWTQSFDTWLVRSLRSSRDVNDVRGPVWLPELMLSLTALADIGLVAVLSVIVVIYFLLRRWWLAAGVLTTVVLGTQATVTPLKLWFSRPRPSFLTHLQEIMTHSFPSGHASLGAALTLTLGWYLAAYHTHYWLKVYIWSCAAMLLVVIGFTRMYLGVHYPTDIAAGFCIGAFWATAGRLLFCIVTARADQPASAHAPRSHSKSPRSGPCAS